MSCAVIDAKKLIKSFALPLLTAVVASIGSGNAAAFYRVIAKPSFAPPGWIFSVVWPLLYLLMGYAAYRIDNAPADIGQKSQAQLLFRMQLLLNAVWPAIFFSLGQIKLGFWVLAVLVWLAGGATLQFFRIDKPAGFAMLPYLMWLVYALVLNMFIAIMN